MKRASKIRSLAALLAFPFLILLGPVPFTRAQTEPQTAESLPARSAESQPQPLAESLPVLPPFPDLKISINIPIYTLALYEKGKLIKEYKVAIGQPKYPSPTGSYNIERIEWNPWWYPPDSPWAEDAEVTPPGPGNPLGPVKMVMETDLRVHGTNRPGSVGRAASHGCFRMRNDDARELAWYLQSRSSWKHDEALPVKYKKHNRSTFVVKLDHPVPVEIGYQPIFVTPEWVQIYPDLYWKIPKIKDKVIEATTEAGLDPKVYDEKKLAKIKRAWKPLFIPTVELLPELSVETISSGQPVQQ